MTTDRTPLDLSKFDGHTPGPWRARIGRIGHSGFGAPCLWIEGANGEAVVFWTGFDRSEIPKSRRKSNAKLLAASTDLLRELREAREEIERLRSDAEKWRNHLEAITNPKYAP